MQLVHLESIDDPQVEAYTNLTELQLRNRLEPSKGIFIAESPKVITRALAAGRQPISLLVEEPWIEGMSDIFAFIDEHWGDDIPSTSPLPNSSDASPATGCTAGRWLPCVAGSFPLWRRYVQMPHASPCWRT